MEILHRADVNIASMNVARSVKTPVTVHDYSSEEEVVTAGGASSVAKKVKAAEGAVQPAVAAPMALCFMSLDDDVSTNAMAALLSLNFLHNVAKIQLQ